MRTFSISTRLAIWYGLSVLLLLGVVVTFLYVGFHVTLHRDFDAQMRAAAAPLVRTLTPFEGRVPPGFDEATSAASGTVTVEDRSGTEIYRGGRQVSVAAIPVRRLAFPLTNTQGEAAGALLLVMPESDLHREMHRLGWLLVLSVVIGVTIAALTGYALARRALLPVAALTEAAQHLGPGARLPASTGVKDELTDLAAAFNTLLGRIDASFERERVQQHEAVERERRFRADAAHQLLTPITAAQSEVDVVLRRVRDAEVYRAALSTVRGHLDRMGALVEGLLALARAESDEPIQIAPVKVSAVAENVVRRMQTVAEIQGITLTFEDRGAANALASADALDAMLENLIDNAVKYTPPGGCVAVKLERSESEVIITVADTGVGFAPEEAGHVFERFYRSEAAAVQEARGSGLGLTIVQRLAQRQGARVEVVSRGPHQGTVARIVLRIATALESSDVLRDLTL